MKKLVYIIIIFISYHVKAQICSPEAIILIDTRVSYIDSLINNDSANLKVYVQTADDDKIIPITDLENYPDNLLETYRVILDKDGKPILFSLSPYSESGDWDLVHSFYFDSNGNTIFYRYSFSFFNGICEKILRKFVDIYFEKDFKPIRESEYYKDEGFTYIPDISNCQDPYMFNLIYSGCKSSSIIIKKFNIILN
jgi:hypothetical protein